MLAAVLVLTLLAGSAPASAWAQSQMTWAVHISLAPTWFDPAEHTGIITLMTVLYAVHDAMVKPMPGHPMTPSLAESWTMSKDGLTYEFVVRKGVLFHNGDPLTAEDVKFSFERYRGAAARLLKDKVAAVEVVDPLRIRFWLKEPWPDFMTFYASPATGAGWIVPKKYVEKVGDEGFKKAPIGGAVQARLLQSRRRAGPRRVRSLLAQEAGREATGVQGRARRPDEARDVEAR